MTWNDAARPGDHRTVTTGKWRHIFMTGEALTFTLSAGAATSWNVRDYYGTIVASGSGLSTSATTVTPSALPLGWYKLYLVRSSAAANPWGLAGGELPFIVARASSVLPVRPTSPTMWQDPVGEGIDPTRSFARLGTYRHTISTLGAGSSADVTKCVTDVGTENSQWGTVDTARPLRQFANFPNGTGGASPTGGDTSAITSAVTSLVAAGCTRFEGRNEPDISNPSAYLPELTAFAGTVRAAGGLVVGPCPVNIVGADTFIINPAATSGYHFLRDLFIAGGGTYIDVFSFHNYNGVQGDLALGRRTLDGFVALLTQYSQQSKPRINSEAYSYFAAVYGSYEPRLQTAWTMLEMHLLEQYSVPKENTSYFYDRSHGFWNYPSWWINSETDSTLNPLAAVVRVWSDELAGKAYAGRLDFGTDDNAHFIGSRFAASDGSAVVALQSAGRNGQVTLQVSAGTSSLVTVDPWGTTTTSAVTGGLMVVNVAELPVYVRLPTGVTATPVIVGYGVDTVTPRASAVAVSNPAPTTFPAFKTLTFPNSTRLNKVVVTTGPPWQLTCGLLDFDVQALISGTWTTLATEVVPTTTVTWASHHDAGAGYTDSFYSRRNQFVYRLASVVTATAVRVQARDVTYGGGATSDTTTGAGKANVFTFGTATGTPTAGTFTITVNGLTTATVAWNASAATVQTALRALAGLSAVVATGGPLPGTPVAVDFILVPVFGLTVTSSVTGGTIGVTAAQGTGQAGPKTFACSIGVFLNEYDLAGNATPNAPLLGH